MKNSAMANLPIDIFFQYAYNAYLDMSIVPFVAACITQCNKEHN